MLILQNSPWKMLGGKSQTILEIWLIGTGVEKANVLKILLSDSLFFFHNFQLTVLFAALSMNA